MGRRADTGAEPTTGRRSRPSLSEIAEEAGVSTATGSKVLNGRTDVASATRERVTALLKTHNHLAPGTFDQDLVQEMAGVMVHVGRASFMEVTPC